MAVPRSRDYDLRDPAAVRRLYGDVRPDVTDTDMPLLSLSLGTTNDFAGHVEPEIWRRHLGIVLDGLRTRRTHT